MSNQNIPNNTALTFTLSDFGIQTGYRATVTDVSAAIRSTMAAPSTYTHNLGGSAFGTSFSRGSVTAFETFARTGSVSFSAGPISYTLTTNNSSGSGGTFRVDDFIVSGDTYLLSRGTAVAGALSAPRVYLGQTASQAVTVGNNLVGLTAGTGANDMFAYSIAGGDYVTLAGSAGNLLNSANLAVVNVGIDTTSVGTKGGSLTVTPTYASTNYSVNGTVGSAPAVLSTSTVDVVEQRVVTSTAVSFPAAIVGTPLTQQTTYQTTGSDSTRTRVTLANAAVAPNGDGVSLASAPTALFDDAADDATRDVNATFAAPGAYSGTIGQAVTGEGLAGEGAYADVATAYTGTALAHSNGAFSLADDNDLDLGSVGTLATGQTATGSFTLYNLQSNLDPSANGDYTATLEVDVNGVSFASGDNAGTLSIDSVTPIPGGGDAVVTYHFLRSFSGAFSSVYTLSVGDLSSILGGLDDNGGALSLSISGLDVSAIPEPLTAMGVLLLTGRVLGRRVRASL